MLRGPQGTLYGASSEAGTIRIISNKPDTSGSYGAAEAEANMVRHGGVGGKVQGFFNAPLSPSAALRVVVSDRGQGIAREHLQGKAEPPDPVP